MTAATALSGEGVVSRPNLPEGWAIGRVHDCFESWGGATPSTAECTYWGGRTPWISSKDVKQATVRQGTEFITDKALRETRLRLCPPGTVLVVVRSGILVHTLPVAVTELPVVINQDLKAFLSSEPTFNQWLALSLRHRASEILGENRKDGTTVQSVRVDQLRDLDLAVPPLAEQKRIVAKVGELVAAVNAAREHLVRVPAILKRFRQSALAAACSGRLTEDWRPPGPSAEAAGGKGPFPLPESWRWHVLRGLLVDIRGGSTAVPKNDATAYPILRSSSVRPGVVNFSDVRYLSPRDAARDAAVVADGDLLFTRLSGSLEFVGNCALVSGVGARRIWFPDRIFRARLVAPKQAEFIEKVFAAPFIRRALTEEAKSSAGHQRISISAIESQVVPLSPAAEQHEIVRRVDALFQQARAIEKRVADATARADKLTQAILAKAFRGELVPTEAELARQERREYEPASVLLERIRREKAEGSAAGSGAVRKPQRAPRARA